MLQYVVFSHINACWQENSFHLHHSLSDLSMHIYIFEFIHRYVLQYVVFSHINACWRENSFHLHHSLSDLSICTYTSMNVFIGMCCSLLYFHISMPVCRKVSFHLHHSLPHLSICTCTSIYICVAMCCIYTYEYLFAGRFIPSAS